MADIKLKDLVDEVLKKKVVRKGKVVRKLDCPPGKKAKDGRCVVMKAQEKLHRKKSAKRGAIKRKSSKAKSNIARKKSARKRKAMNL
jgi:hypothetical protein